MVNPQASTRERRVTSKYWADECQPKTCRGKSVPAFGSKRAVPECDGSSHSTGVEAERLRRKHAKTFDFKPAHHDEVEVKDEPTSTQPSSDSPDPTLPQTNVPVEPLPPSEPFRLSPSTFPAKSCSSVPAVKPACKSNGSSEIPIRCQEPPTRPRDPREEEAIIATLAHICDESVTEATINLVLRWGREAPNPPGESDDLGIAYLKGIVARIDKHGIAPDRRLVVVDLLCSRYTRHLEDLKSRIETLSAPQLPLSPPSSIDRPVQLGENATENDR